MPLLTFDLIEGRTEQEIRTLLDAAHRAVLRAFEVPERDRYQDCSRKQSPPYGD
ncbi:4-oxalocrotonate tautomerase family protein [Klebsiella variicola subsp. variicola]|nr:4-oxalocrotonate tautomerase family protein [Klebsiella variicola subsp. variicola]